MRLLLGIAVALLLVSGPVSASAETAEPKKGWQPTDLKSCRFDAQKFKKMDPRLKWGTGLERVETVFALAVPVLFLGLTVFRGFVGATTGTSKPYQRSLRWNDYYVLSVALFVLWFFKTFFGLGTPWPGAADYGVFLGGGVLWVEWRYVENARTKRAQAAMIGGKFCRRCVEVVEGVYTQCPSCGQKL